MAVVAGAALHLAVQLPLLRIAGMRWQPFWDLRDAAVRDVGRLMGPRVIGLGAYHLNFVVATFFASTVATGAISAINYAWLIVMTPLGLFGMAISTAIFPRLAEQAASDDVELQDSISRALRLILYLTVPAAVGLMLLARPTTSFLLQSGAFDDASVDLVVGALVFYSVGLAAHSGIEILSRGFYALEDTRTPVQFAVLSMVINFMLSLLFVIPFGVNGLAAALSIATIVEFALLWRALADRLHGLDGGRIVYTMVRVAAGTLLMAQVIALWLAALVLAGLWDLGSKADAGLALAGGVIIGGVVYFYATRLLRTEEAEVLVERVPLPARLRSLVR